MKLSSSCCRLRGAEGVARTVLMRGLKSMVWACYVRTDRFQTGQKFVYGSEQVGARVERAIACGGALQRLSLIVNNNSS